MATGQPIQVKVGDIELLVETVPAVGTERTAGRAEKAVERAADAFARAQDAIVQVAKSTTQMIEKAAVKGARPDGVEIEFGLKFSATGSIIMAGATGEATLRVTLMYHAASHSPGEDAVDMAPGATT